VRRALRLGLLAVAVIAMLLLFVLPGRTFLSQEHTLSATQRQVNDLTAENAKLQAEAKNLRSDAEIEKIAREEYGLVMPGQKAYAIIPGPASTTTSTAPADHSRDNRSPSRPASPTTSTATTSTTLTHRT
jgi:cell division protein FtsB